MKFQQKVMDRQLSDLDYIEISKIIGDPDVWKKVGRRLGVQNRYLSNIDYTQNDNEEKAYQMLEKWKENSPDHCTFRNVTIALRQEAFNDKAKQLLNLEINSLKRLSRVFKPHKTSSNREWKTYLQWRLKDFYKKFTLPQLPWVKRGEDLTFKEFYSTLELSSTKKEIVIEDIFEFAEQPLSRILIEGQPGFGKTTLMTKLAYDWAMGEEYMEKFALVFIIKLIEMENKDIPSAICEIARHCGFSDEEIVLNTLEENLDDVLILLDGFDEIPEGVSRKSTVELLHKTLYFDATVAITCRNGMFEIRKGDRNSYNIPPPTENKFWDEKITLFGLSADGMEKLLGKILSKTQAKDLADKLERDNSAFFDICKCPLIVMVLGYLYANGDIIEFCTTRTKVYTNILNGLGNYNLQRRKEYVKMNFCFFSGRSKVLDLWIEKLREFGKNCFDVIKNSSKLQFNDSDLNQEIYTFGFLCKNQYSCLFKKTNYFEPLHRSFVEFFAAFYASQEYAFLKDNETVAKLTEELHENYWKSDGTWLVLPFTAGLMGSTADKLFSNLYANAPTYHSRNSLLGKIVEECEQDERLSKSIAPLLPTDLVLPPTYLKNPELVSSNFIKSVVDEWMNKGDSRSIVFVTNRGLHGPSFCGYLHTIHFELCGDCFTQKLFEQYYASLNQVSCFQLVLTFSGTFTDTMENSRLLGEWLTLKEKLNAKQVLLKNCDSSVCELLMSIEKLPENIFLLHCDLTSAWDNWCSFLNHVVTNSHIQMLRLQWTRTTSQEELQCIIETISKCPQSVSIANRSGDSKNEIDLSLLTSCREKIFDYLSFEDFTLTSNDSKMEEIKAYTLQTFDCKIDSNVVRILLNSNILALKCDSNIIEELMNFETKGLNSIHNTITDLALNMWGDGEAEFWNYLTNFRKTNRLILRFSSFESMIPECAIESLQSMQLKSLQLRFISSKMKSILFERLKLFSKGKKTGSSNPLIISVVLEDVYVEDETPVREFTKQLLNMIENGLLHEIVIEDKQMYAHCDPVSWIDKKKFEVKFDSFVPRNHTTDFVGLDSSQRSRCNMLTITKRGPIS